MKYKIVNYKKTTICVSILLAIVTAVIVVVCFNYFKPKGKEVAKIDDIEETHIQEPDGEFIDITKLEEQGKNEEEEKNEKDQEPQNVVQGNSGKNENTQGSNNTKNKMPYYIKVNYEAQVVTIYQKDSEGNYTVPVKAMICSTGKATPTSGVYSIPARWEWLRLQGYVWGHYSTQITGNILFHSVPYLTKGDPASLEYWEYDKLGTYASAGCVRLTVKDAKWIFNNCAKGTKVEFYSDSNPGPLGKPTAKKISSYADYLRNWDPTDTNPSNPWLTYKPEDNTKPKNEIENNVSNEIKNEVVNDVTNTISNSIVNETTNTISNSIVNESTNTMVNETTDKVNNITQDKENNENVNKIENNTYINKEQN